MPTHVELFVDPSCPWAWSTATWLREVAPIRDLSLTWQSYCLEIRDDHQVPAHLPANQRDFVQRLRSLTHGMLRICEAARARDGEDAVDRLYTGWTDRLFVAAESPDEGWLSEGVHRAGLDPSVAEAADDERWDGPIRASMARAYEFAGDRAQTPVLLIHGASEVGIKGPVMSPAPTGDDAARLWDAVALVTGIPGFFELTRPRGAPPLPPARR